MTFDELLERIEHIRDEYCPTTSEQVKAGVEKGDFDPCGCAICSLLGALLVDEILHGAGITKEETSDAPQNRP